MKPFYLILFALQILTTMQAQTLSGKVFDADTKEPLAGASIKSGDQLFITAADGSFIIPVDAADIEISFASYHSQKLKSLHHPLYISLQKNNHYLQDVFVSANREASKRTESPVALSNIPAKTILDTKATSLDQLMNKASGVFMVNLGNEQHSMGIRQPMSTRSLFLYLEDGIPVRSSGVFNHNAMMEMNMASVKRIEIIKGPGGSLYGGEAIGGVINLITQSPTALPTLKLSAQLNNIGYRRADIQMGFTQGKWGFNGSGYYAKRQNGFMDFTDFKKAIGTARIDYRFTDKTKLENSFTYMDYYSDMTGGVDSMRFFNKSFTSQQSFTYRKSSTLRMRSTLLHEWNKQAKSTVHLVYRKNSLGQNPAYRIRDDYRRTGNSFTGKKDLAHGEINENAFKSIVFIAQHRQQFAWMNTSLIGGATIDASPNTSVAHYIKIRKDSLANKYTHFENRPDSLLVNYTTGILNVAGYLNLEFSPIKNLRVVGSIRYDAFRYNYNNHLPVSALSGSADTTSNFSKISPKIGITYQLAKRSGLYFNYSEGFVPPQVTELYRAVKIPSLKPALFVNYEAGGWTEIIKNRLTLEASFYYMEGKNSIISVRFDDGSFGNANAGATLHRGLELGLVATPIADLQMRLNGAFSKHYFKNYNERGVSYNGHEMSSAPRWIHNAEITYRPAYLKGLRISVEWQTMSEYYMDQTNDFEYPGFDLVNARVGYAFKNAELWINVLNLLDTYYAVNSSRSSFGTSYTVGEPRNINVGVSYDLGKFFQQKSTK